MNNLAETFLGLLESLDAFTVRNFFISLGAASQGSGFIITFSDHSQASLTWIRIGEEINDQLMFREAPDRLWRQKETV